jgi:hypothetical protein
VTVTTLCPGFTKTEFHERMNVRRGSGFLWLEPEFLVSECLKDFDKGKSLSIPSRRYQAIITATRMVPTTVTQRFQHLGRR